MLFYRAPPAALTRPAVQRRPLPWAASAIDGRRPPKTCETEADRLNDPNATENPNELTDWLAYPAFDRREDQLRQKIQSKMAVSTFLVACFTSLFQVLSDQASFSELSHFYAWIWHFGDLGVTTLQETAEAFHTIAIPLAAVCLTLSLVLFIGTIYSYDNLAMPFHRWQAMRIKESHNGEIRTITREIPSKIQKSEKEKLEDEITFHLYSFMMRVWANGFNWAVGFSALGLFFIVCRVGPYEVQISFILTVVLGWIWVRAFVRPRIFLVD